MPHQNREQFVQVAHQLPGVALSLVGTLAERLEQPEDQLETAASPVIVRLGRTLLRLIDRFGQPDGESSYWLEIDLRQEDLAALTGSTRVTITHTLGLLRKLGLVESTRGSYRVNAKRPHRLS